MAIWDVRYREHEGAQILKHDRVIANDCEEAFKMAKGLHVHVHDVERVGVKPCQMVK